jgi:hypothetical protein
MAIAFIALPLISGVSAPSGMPLFSVIPAARAFAALQQNIA